MHHKPHYIIPIFVPNKGCPHNCIFCDQKKITGQQDIVDEKFVQNEISTYLKTIPEGDRIVEVSFFGGSFTGIPVNEQIRLLTPAKSALDAGVIDAIRLSTRPDYIDDNILDVLKEYGVSIIELGVQSLDNEVLSLSNRGHSASQVYTASALIKKRGFVLGLQMMVGLPGDTMDKDIFTAREFVKLAPSMVRIYPALVIKGTHMEDMYLKGEYHALSLDDAVHICSKLDLIFTVYGINIIRIGLQPTDTINSKADVVAGPFHPAFRELVESKIMNDMAMYMYKKLKHEAVEIIINSRSLSKLYGGSKKYFSVLQASVGKSNLKIRIDDSMELNTLKLSNGEDSLIMSIKDYSLIN